MPRPTRSAVRATCTVRYSTPVQGRAIFGYGSRVIGIGRGDGATRSLDGSSAYGNAPGIRHSRMAGPWEGSDCQRASPRPANGCRSDTLNGSMTVSCPVQGLVLPAQSNRCVIEFQNPGTGVYAFCFGDTARRHRYIDGTFAHGLICCSLALQSCACCYPRLQSCRAGHPLPPLPAACARVLRLRLRHCDSQRQAEQRSMLNRRRSAHARLCLKGAEKLRHADYTSSTTPACQWQSTVALQCRWGRRMHTQRSVNAG